MLQCPKILPMLIVKPGARRPKAGARLVS